MATINAPVRSLAAQASLDPAARNGVFHLTMAALTAALLASATAALTSFGYRMPASLSDLYTFCGALGIACAYCAWARLWRLLQSCLLVLWSCVLSLLLKFPMYLVARSHIPLKDHALAQIDQSFGFNVSTLVQGMALHPWIRAFFALSYQALFPLMVLAVLLPAVRYRFRAVKELIIATACATLMGAVLFRWVPAIGPWVVYGYTPGSSQLRCQDLLLTLRAGSVHVLDLNESGIVCFPSFHTVLAIVSCVSLWSIKPLRIPAAAVAALIVISTLTTGWHYLVDVLGGLLLAILSVACARSFTAFEQRIQQRSSAN
ncbi:phosphatase PAP2 family protein [Acidobacteria bacterium AB60]|nr:phosphatase PAP2 family protein [Acidobacteria bacterium AB60]